MKKDGLSVIFENLNAEIQQTDKVNKKRAKGQNIKGEPDEQFKKEVFVKQSASFKSAVGKGEDACQKLHQKPVSLNEDRLRVNFKRIDAKINTPNLKEFALSDKNSRFYKVPICQLNQTGCTLATRKAAKLENKQDFNSSMQVEEDYLVKRNIDSKGSPLKKKKNFD